MERDVAQASGPEAAARLSAEARLSAWAPV
jgi:hypothetical protein